MSDIFNYSRRNSDKVVIGKVLMGGDQPVRVQTMANTDTNDTMASVEQCIRIVKAGGEIVRFTAQGVKEAENLKNIRKALNDAGYDVPLVADIHFNANAADVAARYVEKVRVNPGNFIGVYRSDGSDFTEEAYQAEYEKIKVRFTQLLNICKEYGTAVRIGVNHGSLSERMMNRWGDTPRGMVESCLEFLEVCQTVNFHNVVISMKASNSLSMVHAVRLLIQKMDERNMHYPLHLGVTEAGDGEDGRIKSAVGIGTLLHDGIGDTIRVSLSEEPEFEIPVGRALVDHINAKTGHQPIEAHISNLFNQFEYNRRKTFAVKNIGGEHVPVVVLTGEGNFNTIPDMLLKDNQVSSLDSGQYPVFNSGQLEELKKDAAEMLFLHLTYPELNDDIIEILRENEKIVILLSSDHQNYLGETRAFFHSLLNKNVLTPVIICKRVEARDLQDFQIRSAADAGALLLDGFGDGILLESTTSVPNIEQVCSVSFGILQATRVRVTKTEFISCPGCGRTMFNLQTVIARVKARTSHLKGLKLAIMGCIVNGPGEMADADYGYVGAGRGKVSLYKKKEVLERNINEEDAVDKLIELIKTNGDWHD